MNSIQKVNDICKSILSITDKDLAAIEKMAKEQSEYIHPLKNATAGKYHELGNHNLLVFEALKNIRNIIKAGATVAKKKTKIL